MDCQGVQGTARGKARGPRRGGKGIHHPALMLGSAYSAVYPSLVRNRSGETMGIPFWAPKTKNKANNPGKLGGEIQGKVLKIASGAVYEQCFWSVRQTMGNSLQKIPNEFEQIQICS